MTKLTAAKRAPSPSAHDTAEGKRDQRARNADAAKKAGFKPTRSGSTGASMLAKRMTRVEWEEVESQMVHAVDVAAVISGGQVLAGGGMAANLNVGPEWAHDLLDAITSSQFMGCMIRLYVAPLPTFGDYDDLMDGDAHV